jgi:hypothetical protein
MKQIDGGLRLAIEAAGDRTRVPELIAVREYDAVAPRRKVNGLTSIRS